MRAIEEEQRRVCQTHGAVPQVPADFEKVGIAVATMTARPLNGLRHPPAGDTCGWYIWGGEELCSDADFFQPLHVSHLTETCPEVLRFLGLPPGWRFLVTEKVADVWYDPSLLGVE